METVKKTKIAAIFIMNKGEIETNVQVIERHEDLILDIKYAIEHESGSGSKGRRLKNIKGLQTVIKSLKVSLTAEEHFERMKKLNVIEDFKKAIEIASSDEHDIESAYEEVIKNFKTKYSELSNELDQVWNKMCSDAEKEYK